MNNQKYVFLKALIVTIVVFNLGIYMGYKLESSRLDKINDWYSDAEMKLLDQRIQKDAFDLIDLDCEAVLEENIAFADSIFEDALKIAEYEKANKLGEGIVKLHERYDLLRTLFWMNSMRIKSKCGLDYFNVVYFYDYYNPTLEQESKQNFFSNLLEELKKEHGAGIMLIPISGDSESSSIKLLVEKYGISELPAILIDEQFIVTNPKTREDIEQYLK